MRFLILAALCATPVLAEPAAAPAPNAAFDPESRMASQREAMKALAFLDGAWRGPAKAAGVAGDLVQTERVGTLLDGTIRLVEGRGYDADGRTVFNAFAMITYDPVRRAYTMRSHANGFVGEFPLAVRPDGFDWSQPAGPGAAIRYRAMVKDGEWHEIGERVAGDAAPVRTVEMRLRRLGDTAWPKAETVPIR